MKHLIKFTLCFLLVAPVSFAQQASVTSILEIYDIRDSKRTIVKEFPFLIEAPNWTPDGKWLVYNSGGKLYKLSPTHGVNQSKSQPVMPTVATTTM